MMSFFEVPLSLSARAVPTIVHRAVLLPAAAARSRLYRSEVDDRERCRAAAPPPELAGGVLMVAAGGGRRQPSSPPRCGN